ncbi:MAG: CDC27 family protein, partial [Cytophagales bacterium]|nr:CDC27 family protein [Cytophagales bacterium]
MKKIIPISAIFLSIWFQGFAQPRQTKNLSDKEHKVLADAMIEKGGYYGAAAHLEDVLKKEPNNKLLILKLGESYFYSRDYLKAEEWLKRAKDNDPKIQTQAVYLYAECLKYNGKYEQARDNYILFSNSKYKERAGEKLKMLAKNQITSCEYAIKKRDNLNAVNLVHLGDNINSGYTEFSPRLKNDSTLIFASLQSDSVITVAHEDVHFEHTKLYLTSFNREVGHWSQPEELKKLNSKFESTANGAYSIDGKQFYFTRCYQSDDHRMICRIYVSEMEGGEFKKPKKLPS